MLIPEVGAPSEIGINQCVLQQVVTHVESVYGLAALGRCTALISHRGPWGATTPAISPSARVELLQKLWLVSVWRVSMALRDPEDVLRRLDRHAHLVVSFVGGLDGDVLARHCRRPTARPRWKERLWDRRARCYGTTLATTVPDRTVIDPPTHPASISGGPTANGHPRRILSIGFPLASSSTSLSK
jgi:hypothetical protein